MVNFLSKLLDIRGKRGYNISSLPLLGGRVVWFPRWCGCWRGVFLLAGSSPAVGKLPFIIACERVEGYSSSVSAGTNSSPEKS